MTRDELEAVIWHEVPFLTARQVDAILKAHDAAVGTALGEIDNYRRKRREPVIHLLDDFSTSACNGSHSLPGRVLTEIRKHVTCASCKRTRSFREAA